MSYMIACDICGRKFDGKDKDYRYWSGHTFCVDHPGVTLWYEGAMAIADYRLSRIMEGTKKELL